MTDRALALSALDLWLYVPGHRPDLLAGAGRRDTDAVIADLEDAVPPAEAASARAHVAAWVAAAEAQSGVSTVIVRRTVRIGAANLAADLEAIVGPGLTAIMLAKSELPLLERVHELLVAHEGNGAPVPVVALVETAAGLLQAAEMATHPRVASLAIGEADLAAELRITPSADDRELLPLRSQLILAASAAGLPAPMAPVYTDFTDPARLKSFGRAVYAQGFGAFAAIHPAQLAVFRAVLRPSDAAVRDARAVEAAFVAADGGAAMGPDGRMIDLAVVRRARQVLARRERVR